ncbi:uncharacterized protein LOC135954779 [Calliphora vicina]|uniref:uncharacterized protein LOC135954779 n=1 Tax=Calliphora vicina TaxID=7373 RepID=UPI00325B77C4
MGADVDFCKRKWKQLRGSYTEELKKLELRIVEDKINGSYDPNNEYKCTWIFFEHMKFIDGTIMPRPLKRGNDNNSADKNSPPSPSHLRQNSSENQTTADDKPTTSNGKCTKRSYDQANFLEDIEKDKHKLIKTPHSDITDSNNMVHLTDSDYNFLVSFLPQMKKINVLQNLQFRTKITNLMLSLMSQSKAN